MSKVYNVELQRQVREHLLHAGISQAQLSKRVGISSTALSQYLSSTYGGDVPATERKLQEYLQLQAEQIQAQEQAAPYLPSADYIPTSISEDVYKGIKFAQLERGMVILHGDAGIGKTKGAQKFLRDNPHNAVYISVSPSTGTLSSVIKLLARALHVPEMRNKMDLMLAIREKIEGTGKVVIIDEAQHLKLAALEELRTLSDADPATGIEGNGVCLIGNTEVYNRMMGKAQAQFAQLFSRIKMNRSYTTRKVRKEDVAALFPRLAQDKRVRELDFLLGIAQGRWGIRGAVNVYNNSVKNEDISYDGLYKMAVNMGVGLI